MKSKWKIHEIANCDGSKMYQIYRLYDVQKEETRGNIEEYAIVSTKEAATKLVAELDFEDELEKELRDEFNK